MEFDTNFREDLPLLSTLLSDHQTPSFKLQDPKNNGLNIPLESSSKLPCLLFQDSNQYYNNESNLNPSHHQNSSFGHISNTSTTGVSISNSIPFSHHIPTQSVDPFGSKIKGLFFKDNFNYSMPNFLASDHDNTQNKSMHNGFQSGSTISLWDYGLINQNHQPSVKSQIYPPPLSSTGFSKDDISLITSTDQNGYNQKRSSVDHLHQKIRTRTHVVMRKGGANRGSKKSNIIKGQWTPHEDKMLLKLVERYGDKKWAEIAKVMEGRMGKQCRERWHNHLRPHIRKDTWSEEEDKVLIEAHKEMGNKWAEIARRLPGRSENTIKNHWNATKRRQISMSKKKNNKKDSNNNNKSNQVSSVLLQNYIRSLMINSSSSTSATSIGTNPPGHDHDDENNIADQYLNIIYNAGIESSDVSSGDQLEAQLLFDDHNEEAAIGVVGNHDYDNNHMFCETNYMLDDQKMLEASGSGINYNDSSSSLDLEMSFEIDDQVKKEMDLLEMIIFSG